MSLSSVGGEITLDAVVLAGGRSSRMAGTDKVALEHDGRSLVHHGVGATLAAGANRVVVVGPERAGPWPSPVMWVREDPPFGGPVAAIAAAAPHLSADWVILVASDIPRIGEALPRLLATVSPDSSADAYVFVDVEGHRQWLVSVVRRAALHVSLEGLDARDSPVRRLFRGLELCEVPDVAGVTQDVDTWTDWAKLRAGDPEK